MNNVYNTRGNYIIEDDLDTREPLIISESGSGETAIQIENSVDVEEEESNSYNMSGNDYFRRDFDRLSASGRSAMQANIVSLFNEARTQFGRQTSAPDTRHPRHSTNNNASNVDNGTTSTTRSLSNEPQSGSSWRTNFNNVLTFTNVPSREAIRSLIHNSRNFRYHPINEHNLLHENNNPVNPNQLHNGNSGNVGAARLIARNARSNSLREEGIRTGMQQHQNSNNENRNSTSANETVSRVTSPLSLEHHSASNRHIENATQQNRNAEENENNQEQQNGDILDDENNVISDVIIRTLGNFIRYLPFICILCIKFIHDHLLGIMDLLVLHSVMFQINKSLRKQVAKLSQKNYSVLLRDFSVLFALITYRIMIINVAPDPFGLIITPPVEFVTHDIDPVKHESGSGEPGIISNYINKLVAETHTIPSVPDSITKTVSITKAISIGILLYYVTVNDLVLKLITILIKICVTLLPARIIRHKPRARMYVMIEYASQFYRALVPVHQWLNFFLLSYTGLELVSGLIFSSFYMGAKGFEFINRGKSFQKALINFVRNMDYERKPTKEELEAAGTFCPICHDNYKTPVILECNHIFCDDCVGTWFKREQTCPMCRAKVSDDPAWQDGSTTYFFQFC